MLKDFIDYKNELNLTVISLDDYSHLFVTATKTGRIRNRLAGRYLDGKYIWVKL